MKTRFLSSRIASALAVAGFALVAFVAAPAAQAQIKVVTLTTASVDKLGKFIDSVNGNADSKAAMDEMGKDQDIGTAAMSGGTINDMVNTKYPKAAAVFKSGGYTPDEFNNVILSLALAASGQTEGASDADIAKKNVDFYNANKDKIDKMMASMK